MQYTTAVSDNILNITLSDSFTFRDNGEFRNLMAEIETLHVSEIICNVSALEFVDSAALGMFLLLRDAAEKKNADVVLKDAQGQVKKMFDVAKFSQLFDVK